MAILRVTARRRTEALAAEAFVFAFPLVLSGLTRAQLTATDVAGPLRAPLGQFAHQRQFPVSPLEPVLSPNTDTLLSSAWLDLAAEPLVLSWPDTHGRYWSMALHDAWSEVFAAPGIRNVGGSGAELVLVGPRWLGTLPDGVPAVPAPSESVWAIARFGTDGPGDYPAVHAVQDGLHVTRLSVWDPRTPPAPQHPAPSGVVPDAGGPDVGGPDAGGPDAGGPGAGGPGAGSVAAMDPRQYFSTAARLMSAAPPRPEDAPVLTRMSRLGIVPGHPPDWSLADTALVRDIGRGMAEGLAQIEAEAAAPRVAVRNGWHLPYDVGRYGRDYLRRAGMAWAGLGGPLAQDTFSPTARLDGGGRPLCGDRAYRLRFPAGGTPPVHGFWSLSLYDDQHFFVEAPGRRRAVGGRDPLRHNPDGSLDILIQRHSPGPEREPNWLPSPVGPFTLGLRLYWPGPAALDGRWVPPAVVRA